MKDVYRDFIQAFMFAFIAMVLYNLSALFFENSLQLNWLYALIIPFIVANVYVFKNLVNDLKL